MPLTINVGLSRKASENYQSTGVSINVCAELDQSLLARPEELQQQIDRLYGQASDALDRQTAQPQTAADKADMTSVGHKSGGNGTGSGGGNGRSAGNGSTGGNGSGRDTNGASHTNGPVAPATQSQTRAIGAIARRLGIDAAAECKGRFGCDLAKLSLRQASDFIDHLKGLGSAPAAKGGR